jgi:hypothetical protein
MDIMISTYTAYAAVSVALTVWVARTLSKSGAVFLVDVFNGNEKLSDAVNHLLVVGFYLMNLGWISLCLKTYDKVANVQDSIELLSTKLGIVLIMLGVAHFMNLLIFTVIRKRNSSFNQALPPVQPDGFTEISA